jgi:hypothetical protein
MRQVPRVFAFQFARGGARERYGDESVRVHAASAISAAMRFESTLVLPLPARQPRASRPAFVHGALLRLCQSHILLRKNDFLTDILPHRPRGGVKK